MRNELVVSSVAIALTSVYCMFQDDPSATVQYALLAAPAILIFLDSACVLLNEFIKDMPYKLTKTMHHLRQWYAIASLVICVWFNSEYQQEITWVHCALALLLLLVYMFGKYKNRYGDSFIIINILSGILISILQSNLWLTGAVVLYMFSHAALVKDSNETKTGKEVLANVLLVAYLFAIQQSRGA